MLFRRGIRPTGGRQVVRTRLVFWRSGRERAAWAQLQLLRNRHNKRAPMVTAVMVLNMDWERVYETGEA